MEYIINKRFDGEEIKFDGNHYIGCTFNNCIITISSLHFNYDRCTFKGSSFKLSPSMFYLQNVYSLLPSSTNGKRVQLA
ncbi:hypothetical protein SAMN04487969_11718 [Paenibacillus algorifonticola]|uniref:Pentapeptide repeat-containing protein n=1 Tax=Paenibacillus algorifonticola TaxID=684063 RepID=A0A1I2GNU9_9BACL|nr:hypothetical protein [Paenibacillus algorifonticola]SFF18690.1 hypothetical protein SAMN04487969_11718 [Paenibacillus algorifonticola]